MRVITGLAKGMRLNAPKGMNTRPTSEKVKEAVFSIIHFDLPGARVLDLFSGSGQMGIEAISRGAKSCVFVDVDKSSVEVITGNIKTVKFESFSKVVNADVHRYISSSSDKYDIVIIDPPYEYENHSILLLDLARLLGDNGIVVYESSKNVDFEDCIGDLKKQKEYGHGITKIVVYKKTEK